MEKHSGLELLFVRHAQPAWTTGDTPQMDPVLTAKGIEQARAAGGRLKQRGMTELWCSDAKRALQTAEIIGEATDMKPLVVPGLTEMRLPDWSKLSVSEVGKRFRESRKREPEAWWDGLAGGESFRDFSGRVHQTLTDLLRERGIERKVESEHPHFKRRRDLGRIVIVGHGGTNAVALSLLLGFSALPWEWERFALNHAGFLRLTSVPLGTGFVFGMRAMNDCEHLPRELRSA